MSAGRTVLLLVTDAGGGHRAGASALTSACNAAAPGLRVLVANAYREFWRDAGLLTRAAGAFGEDLYNFTLEKDLRAGAGPLRDLGVLAARLPAPRAARAGAAYLREHGVELCVSLLPFVNDKIADACGRAGVPLAVVAIDLEDTRPPMWYTPRATRQAVWVAALSAHAQAQAEVAGARRVVRAGLPMRLPFHDPSLRHLDRRAARRALDLDDARFTVLLTQGGRGGRGQVELVRALARSGADWQVLVACGRNQALLGALETESAGDLLLRPLPFTERMDLLLRAADLVVSKTGPGSLFEAVAAGTPMVMDAYRARPHEWPNAEEARRHGLAELVTRHGGLADAVLALAASPARRQAMEAAQAAYQLDNGAVRLAGEIIASAGRER